MLCLTCGTDSQEPGPGCLSCGAWIGYAADGRGYLPQLEVLARELAEGELPAVEAAERLSLLEQALEYMLAQLDRSGQDLMGLELDDSQQGTLGGFLSPVREGLERLLAAVGELDPAGDWSEASWNELREAQLQVVKANEGLAFLTQAVATMATSR